jgi:hypothetical protein
LLLGHLLLLLLLLLPLLCLARRSRLQRAHLLLTW